MARSSFRPEKQPQVPSHVLAVAEYFRRSPPPLRPALIFFLLPINHRLSFLVSENISILLLELGWLEDTLEPT